MLTRWVAIFFAVVAVATIDVSTGEGGCLNNHYYAGMKALDAKNLNWALDEFRYLLGHPDTGICKGVGHFGYGLAFMVTNNETKALEEFRLAIQNDVDEEVKVSERAYVNIGSIFLRWKKFQEAIGAYSKAVEINPKNGEAHYYLGVAYLKAGDIEKAEKESAEARQLGIPFTGLEEDLAAAKNPPAKKPTGKAGGKKTKK